MRPRNSVAALITAGALASATACGGSTGGTAAPAMSSDSVPASSQNMAPKVTQPIAKTSATETDPCSAVSVATVEGTASKVKETRTERSSLGNTCVWVFNNSGGNVSAGVVTANKQGVNALYIQNSRGGLTTFKPQPPILGYPAVVYANGGETEGSCNLAVGIRDDVTYTVIAQLRHDSPVYSDSCGMATKIASAAITHLKGQ
ncbi:DUF3558 domain-containing protein [Amycolatopsis sp. A1MSW2902]|uniref:DUF3558 domain-containing protein n=1 Tax=Amycolatopsis sp. A1MSW2902 TaxID=687413 RepID=UPI00307DEF92